jgi:membrane-associated HD superfamily phosphohydrolase
MGVQYVGSLVFPLISILFSYEEIKIKIAKYSQPIAAIFILFLISLIIFSFYFKNKYTDLTESDPTTRTNRKIALKTLWFPWPALMGFFFFIITQSIIYPLIGGLISLVLLTVFFLRGGYFKFIPRPTYRLKGITFFGWLHIIIGVLSFSLLFFLLNANDEGGIVKILLTFIIVWSFIWIIFGLGLLFLFESMRSTVVFMHFAYIFFGLIGLWSRITSHTVVSFYVMLISAVEFLLSGSIIYYFTRPGVKENFANPDEIEA